MQPIKHFCPNCKGLLKVEPIADTARKNIIRVEVTCTACGAKGAAPVIGVPVGSLSGASAVALVIATDSAIHHFKR